MSETLKFEGIQYQEMSNKDWAKLAHSLVEKHGAQIVIHEDQIRRIDDNTPAITYGAYTCYAGVARNANGLYLFHFDQDYAMDKFNKKFGYRAKAIMGGEPHRQIRNEVNPFVYDERIQWLETGSLNGGFNIMYLPTLQTALYCGGFYNHTASIEE